MANQINRIYEEKLKQGLNLHRQGKLREAEELYREILAENPRNADVCNFLGIIASQKGDHQAAINSIHRAIEISPNNPGYYCNLGLALQKANKPEAAVASYDRAVAIKPDYAEVYCNRGIALRELGLLDRALESYDRAIAIRSDYAEAYSNRANTLSQLQQFDAAVASCDRAIAIRPSYAEAHYNRGNALKELDRFDEALASYDRAIAIKPDYAEAFHNRGRVLKELNRLVDAVASYDRAIALKPAYAEALLSKSLALLLGSDFENGWRLHEWRWKANTRETERKQICQDWDGVSRPRSLLILREQGVGDEIFYSGMINDVLSSAEAVTVCADPRLAALFNRSFDGVHFIADADVKNLTFDAQIYMADLGGLFRAAKTDFARVKSPYLLADPARTRHLRQSLPKEKLICGLSWVSKNKNFGLSKSISLDSLAQIISLPKIEFVNLQYGDTQREQGLLQSERGLSIRNIDEVDNFNDIDGLAALIGACDIVVTVSNTTAHLAAALGKPVYVMLPCSTGLLWYWHAARSDSPWYPKVRLLRQKQVGDWQTVIDELRAALTNLSA